METKRGKCGERKSDMFIILIIMLIAVVFICGVISFLVYALCRFISSLIAEKDKARTRSFIQSGFLAAFTLAFLIGSAGSWFYGDAITTEAMKISSRNNTIGGEWRLLAIILVITGGMCGCIALWRAVSGYNSKDECAQ